MANKELFTLANKIKLVRERMGITQSDVAKRLGLTRSSVNAWEMGLSVPSTPCVVELAKLFCVSTDYLLGLDFKTSLNVDGLDENDVAVLVALAHHLKAKNEKIPKEN